MEAKAELLLHIGISKTYIQHFIDKQMDIKFLDFAEITIKDLTEIEKLAKEACEGIASETSTNGLHLQNVMPSLPEIDFNKMRKAKGLTLREVEKSTGISNAYLSKLETGKIKSPGYNVVKALLELYSNEV